MTSGLYYKRVMILNDNSSIINKWSFKLIDDAWVVIYNRKRFIIHATVLMCTYSFSFQQQGQPHTLYILDNITDKHAWL